MNNYDDELNILTRCNEALKKENVELKNQIDEMKFNYSMEKLEQNDSYSFSRVLQSEKFRKHEQLMMADAFHLESFIPLVKEWGYKRVNNYMVKKLHEEVDNNE